MPPAKNKLGQPIGDALPDWQGALRPGRTAIVGDRCTLQPLGVENHAAELYDAFADDTDGALWTYLSYGPFASLKEYTAWLGEQAASEDPLFYAIVGKTDGCALGVASYLRIEPEAGAMEVGHIALSPRLQKTAMATEAMYLLMAHAFEVLGYRRYEWKCDALNAASRRAALRLGFSFDGIFRQATVYKRRNRDTAWYSILDRDWPALRQGFSQWLDPGNFDNDGRQQSTLQDCLAEAAAPSSRP
ncbi:MAG: GNAT family protein [Pseudomonadota bacterium]